MSFRKLVFRASLPASGACCAVALWFASAVGTASGQELSVFAGKIEESLEENDSYTWEIEYLQGLGEHFAAGFSWINEGHVPDHHRDGHAVRLWARTGLFGSRLSLLAGIGAYRYFDTNVADNAEGFADQHGWGYVFSLGARWYTDSRWLYQVRANWIDTVHNFDSASLTIGVGYQLERPPRTGPLLVPSHDVRPATAREVTLFVGQTIVNSLHSQSGLSTCLEYRQGLSPHLEWTASWLYEGDVELIRRDGLASQLWLVRSFLDDRLSLGVGFGFYYSIDRFRDVQDDESFSGLVTMTASGRLTRRLVARLSWNRVASDYNRDTDVILFGLGRRF